jgi:hypothetical protein
MSNTILHLRFDFRRVRLFNISPRCAAEGPCPVTHVFERRRSQPLEHFEGNGANDICGKGTMILANRLFGDRETGALSLLVRI